MGFLHARLPHFPVVGDGGRFLALVVREGGVTTEADGPNPHLFAGGSRADGRTRGASQKAVHILHQKPRR